MARDGGKPWDCSTRMNQQRRTPVDQMSWTCAGLRSRLWQTSRDSIRLCARRGQGWHVTRRWPGMEVEHEDTDFEWNSSFDGKPVELPKSWADVIPWPQTSDELCSTVEDSAWCKDEVWCLVGWSEWSCSSKVWIWLMLEQESLGIFHWGSVLFGEFVVDGRSRIWWLRRCG